MGCPPRSSSCRRSTPWPRSVYPDSWKPEAIEKGVQGQTAKTTRVYLSVETTADEKEMSAIIDDTFAKLQGSQGQPRPHRQKRAKVPDQRLCPPTNFSTTVGMRMDPTMVSITFVNGRQDCARADVLGVGGQDQEARTRNRTDFGQPESRPELERFNLDCSRFFCSHGTPLPCSAFRACSRTATECRGYRRKKRVTQTRNALAAVTAGKGD